MSVGHVARSFEAAGIPTVVIAVKAFENRMRSMALPRVVLTSELLGRPLGGPFQTSKQIRYLKLALNLLVDARQNGTVILAE